MRNNLPVKLAWILAQGLFLPCVLWLDDLRAAGQFLSAIGVFVLLETLYMADAYLFLSIFNRK